MGIDNTTERMKDPAEAMLFLADAMGSEPSAAIERMERSGQRQLVNSDRLPTQVIGGTDADFKALGFTFGDPDPCDPLFRPATLPEGWKREAGENSRGSSIVDALGRERVSVFYKAAFYDRSAHMSLVSLGWYVTKSVEYGAGPVVFDDVWATREAVLAAMAEQRDEHLQQAARFCEYAADKKHRDAANRRGCAEVAARHEAAAVKYSKAIETLEAQAP